MKFKKHIVLIVGGSVALVAMVITLILLLRFHSSYQRVDSDLQAQMRRLDNLYQRDPYPSEANVLQVQTNLAVLQGYFDELFKSLRQGQIEPKQMEPAEFPLMLEKTIRKLSDRARELGIKLPQRFAFGFERYAAGALPNNTDVPRLMLQLQEVEALSVLLAQAKVSEVVAVTRQVFEQGAADEAARSDDEGRRGRHRQRQVAADPSTGTPAGQPEVIDPSGLFSVEHYEFTFKARDQAVWDALNSFARCRPFVVVTGFEVQNENPLPKTVAAAAVLPGMGGQSGNPASTMNSPVGGGAMPGGLGAKSEMPSHEDRVVAGRELVKVTLELDVYRFLAEKPEEAKQ